MGRVNLDLTFRRELVDDASEDPTTPYLLLCLLLIQIMSQSGPEVRQAMPSGLHLKQVSHRAVSKYRLR